MNIYGMQLSLVNFLPFFRDFIVPAGTFLLGLSVRTFFERRTARMIEGFKSSLKSREADDQASRDQFAGVYKHLIEKTSQKGSDLEKKRIEAIEQCWNAVTEMSPFRALAFMASGFKLNYIVSRAAEKTSEAERIRQLAKVMIESNGNATNIMESGSTSKLDLVRLYLDQDIFDLTTLYRAMCIRPYALLRLASLGESPELLNPADNYLSKVKKALPAYASYIDQYGEDGLSHLIDALEGVLLNRLRAMTGVTPIHDFSIVKQVDALMVEYSHDREKISDSAPPGLKNKVPPPRLGKED